MGLKDGGAGQLMVAMEVTAGLPVTPTIALPFISESLGQEIERMESDDIIAGRRYITSEQWAEGNITIGGDTQHEWKNRNMGKLFAAMIGVPTTTGSGPYTHTYTPGDLPAVTLQKGVPGVGGTVFPLTYSGAKVASWEIGFQAGQFATLGLTWVGMHEIGYRTVSDGVTTSGSASITSATAAFSWNDVGKPISGTGIPAGAPIASVTSATAATLSANATATGTGVAFTLGMALASPSYVSQRSFTFQRGSVSLFGSTAKVKSGTLSGDNGLADDRRFLGQQFIDEALEADRRTTDGSLELEFTDRTHYDRFVRGAEGALVLQFTSGSDTATITTNIRYDGETPKIGGRGIVAQNLPIKCVASGADSTALQVVLVNQDSAY